MAGTIYYWAKEVVYTRSELRRIVALYRQSVEFGWTNQTPEFVAEFQARRYETFSRQLYLLKPRSFAAYRFWKQVRDVVSEYHSYVSVLDGVVLPAVPFDDFPFPASHRGGGAAAGFSQQLIAKLAQIRWLRLEDTV